MRENVAAAVQNWEFQISSLEVFIVIGEVQVRLQQFSPPAIFDTVSSLEINQREISKLFNFSLSCAAVRHTHVLAGVMATSASVKMKPEDDSIKNVNFTKLLERSPRQPSIFLYVTHQHSARWKTFSPGWCGGKSFANKSSSSSSPAWWAFSAVCSKCEKGEGEMVKNLFSFPFLFSLQFERVAMKINSFPQCLHIHFTGRWSTAFLIEKITL